MVTDKSSHIFYLVKHKQFSIFGGKLMATVYLFHFHLNLEFSGAQQMSSSPRQQKTIIKKIYDRWRVSNLGCSRLNAQRTEARDGIPEKLLHELIRFDVIYVCTPTPALPFRGKIPSRSDIKKAGALSFTKKPRSFKSPRNLRRRAFLNLSESEWLSLEPKGQQAIDKTLSEPPKAKQKICFLSFFCVVPLAILIRFFFQNWFSVYAKLDHRVDVSSESLSRVNIFARGAAQIRNINTFWWTKR